MSTYADRRQLGKIPGPLGSPPSASAGQAPDRWTLVNKAMKLTALGNNVYGDCVVAAPLHMAQQQAFYTYGVHFTNADVPPAVTVHGPRTYTFSGSGGVAIPLIPDITDWIEPYVGAGLSRAEANAIIAWWAANYHTIVSTQWIPSYNDAMRVYANTPDFKKGKDDGRFEVDVYDWLKRNGIGASSTYHKAYGGQIAANQARVQEAIYWLGGAVLGLNLPESIWTQRTWKVVAGAKGKPGSFGGHDVCAIGYSPSVLYVVTWGKVIPMTWAFFNKYRMDAWSAATYDWINAYTGKTPLGDTWEMLQARFQNTFDVGGQ